MTGERDISDQESTDDPVVDFDPASFPTADAVPGAVVDEGREPEAGVGDIDPGKPLPQRAPGADPVVGVETDKADDEGVVDKDLLRGGSGEQGEPTQPETDDDLLRGGSGWSDSPGEHEDTRHD